jgi:hypothetical protein
MSVGELAQRARVSFVKVAEFQRRGVVHLHALIRLDGPESFALPPAPATADLLAAACRVAAASVRLAIGLPELLPAPALIPQSKSVKAVGHMHQNGAGKDTAREHPSVPLGHQRDDYQGDEQAHREAGQHPASARSTRLPLEHRPVSGHGSIVPLPRATLLRFGDQVDVQVIGAGTNGGLTPERVAAYLAKYATKSAEEFGLGERRLSGLALSGVGVSAHVARIVRTAWELGAVDELAGLRRWLHMLGFRGHFATKSLRYSTTLGAIRRERADYRRHQFAGALPIGLEDPDRDNSTLMVARWQFAGLGYLTAGDAELALSSAARARERRQAARDHRTDREEDHDG